jgi:hypothetical protein
MLLYLGTDLLQVVRMRPLVSVAVSGDRYSVGYSVTRECLLSSFDSAVVARRTC